MNRGIALDLTHYNFKRELGDIVVYGTWIGTLDDEPEPCLALVPRNRVIGHDRIRPACVALSSAYKYDDEQHLLTMAMVFNKGMGFEDNMTNVHRVASLIHDHLLDLIKMPPRPPRGSTVGAVLQLTDRESGRTFETEVRDDL